ncbi:BlaI/MecI/CopY family transcriptional regulator [Agarilytica rhodophyticola]|uniref:BlaI/MecI/CopY family transcriptional regulator n=1 Tax=Agarilytica rhodophyticola TaxID=1737490 RepID=UPI000B34494B|nr:BlaI/MecI/CopY family transcriptional regulator [Agarilytica rhodophyticola]
MPPIDQMQLSRRERQIMDILFEHETCSAHDVMEKLPDPPSYSSVRALIARLVEKDIVEFYIEGNKHIYRAKLAEKKVQESAIKRLLKTFFRGSRINAVNALLDMEGSELSSREIAELERTIKRIKKTKE